MYKGALSRTASEPPQVVAVKLVKPGARASYLLAMMAELKVMLFIKKHEHVVEVIGAHTAKLIKRRLN